LTAQAEIKTQDEIGILAKTFNTMTNQIRQTLEGLELRVQERTVDLEKAREQTEKRAHALEAISEVSRIIAIEQNLDRLLPLITRMISERFNYYHVGIFLLDDSQTFAILRAANSPGGQRMLARGHKLEVGLTGLVGFVAQKGTPRIALDVGDDAVYFNNPDLPETRSEIALPLNLREHTIGVLDVQSITPASFTEADANTLTILAEQVAIAIDNARLFSETQRALSESQALYRQFVSQAWDNQPGRTNPIGYIQTATGGKQVDKAFKTPEISQAMANGEIVVSASENNEQNNNRKAITVPIKLHNQVIGVLNVRSGENDHNWNEDEIGIMQAVSERIAYALDNARLLGDLQRRAARERSIGQISARIGEANNIDAILRSTVEELGKKLRNTEVVIQITDQNNKRDNSQE
jgi:GAF domain-containing protein